MLFQPGRPRSVGKYTWRWSVIGAPANTRQPPRRATRSRRLSTVAVELAEFVRPSQRVGLRAWLYTVVRNKATDVLRRCLRHPASGLDSAVDAGHEPCSREPDPAAVSEAAWERALLQTALDELRSKFPAINYRLLEMRMLEGRSEIETAAALQLTPEQVRRRKYRMQRQLQTFLSVYTGRDAE
ncbi:MAG: sigma-70 family RNA polymerase sigma factor [Planctomycetota bacterium]|nr:sigma-70 family RNA polymerase sigma factor [Planctomycetota bacterium]